MEAYDQKYAEVRNQTAGYIGAANQQGAALSQRPDGLTSCLARIQTLLNELTSNGHRLQSIADNIGGQEPEKSAGALQAPENPVPSIPLFMARKIEAVLQDQVQSQSVSMNRIERAIS